MSDKRETTAQAQTTGGSAVLTASARIQLAEEQHRARQQRSLAAAWERLHRRY